MDKDTIFITLAIVTIVCILLLIVTTAILVHYKEWGALFAFWMSYMVLWSDNVTKRLSKNG